MIREAVVPTGAMPAIAELVLTAVEVSSEQTQTGYLGSAAPAIIAALEASRLPDAPEAIGDIAAARVKVPTVDLRTSFPWEWEPAR